MNHEKEALQVSIELKVMLSELLPQLELQFFLVCNGLRYSDNLLSICSFPPFVRILKIFFLFTPNKQNASCLGGSQKEQHSHKMELPQVAGSQVRWMDDDEGR